ncbi:MAG: SGNH/GDSL hydrolase family protein [Clostridia bacterium]|nr:SGNH/GDSL hydrolase family protein [Clostridia bacterium]
MADSKNMLANTVCSRGQLEENQYVKFCLRGGKKRVLFFGNSITRHAPKEDIGWSGDWGMAASSADKDYVHLVVKALDEKYGTVDFCIAQGAVWEGNYHNVDEVLEKHFKSARDFGADIVIIRIGENIPTAEHERSSCKPSFEKVVAFLSWNAEQVIVTDLFWNSAKNVVFKEVADEHGYTFVHLTDLEEDERTMAIGLFEHGGVAHHPGDFGMKCIADRITEKL